jgi:hypothetical protein
MCIFYKRLDRDAFRWPDVVSPGATSSKVEERTLEALFDGIDVEAPTRTSKTRTH